MRPDSRLHSCRTFTITSKSSTVGWIICLGGWSNITNMLDADYLCFLCGLHNIWGIVRIYYYCSWVRMFLFLEIYKRSVFYLYTYMSNVIYRAEVARYLEEDSFGLVFGINTMVALIFQTILTLLIISEGGFALSTKGQFTVYAFYFIGVGIIYLVAVVTEYILKKYRRNVD